MSFTDSGVGHVERNVFQDDLDELSALPHLSERNLSYAEPFLSHEFVEFVDRVSRSHGNPNDP